jgi:hypothetical protein
MGINMNIYHVAIEEKHPGFDYLLIYYLWRESQICCDWSSPLNSYWNPFINIKKKNIKKIVTNHRLIIVINLPS